jgi:hypothetical protein
MYARLDPHRAPLGSVPDLPLREPADSEVAAGAAAGLVAGAAAAAGAMIAAPPEQGAFFPLRLAAASLLGHSALDQAAAGPVLLGAAICALSGVALGLVFASILPRGLPGPASVGAGMAFGVAAWAVSWFAAVRLLDPVLFAAVTPLEALLVDLLYGAAAGAALPPLRRILP